jgi:hypothetical protein
MFCVFFAVRTELLNIFYMRFVEATRRELGVQYTLINN